jgi:AcrR family transcriptional regulator
MAKISSNERRGRILKAATALFSRSGFEGTTTRKLAVKAGISEALIFRHFPDKDHLYAAILQQKMDEQVPILLGDLSPELSPEALLKTLARRIVALHEKDASFLRLLLYSALERHKLSDLLFRKRNLPLIEFLSSYFRKTAAEGLTKAADPEEAAFAFTAMVFGFVQTRLIFRIPQVVQDPPEERIERYVDLFLKGISS